jgi:predicted Ser/Thr protein kinase
MVRLYSNSHQLYWQTMNVSNPLTPELPAHVPPTIGPFRVLRLLGNGGMGAVYLGERMEQFYQQVAIKILHPQIFPESTEATMRHEGKVLAAMEHPGAVRMLDLGVAEGGLRYIVMEYVDGLPLDAFCDHHQLSLRRRMELLLDVFDAVEHAHRHLVVHADLKPGNILVTAEGRPRLLDFGVATILSDMGATKSSDNTYTALYASPEQRSGERLTVASDIYSLGLIVQSLLIGVSPNPVAIGALHSSPPGTSPSITARKLKSLDVSLLTQIAMHRATTPSGLISAIQGDVEAILHKALQFDPKERFQSADEMRDELKLHLFGYPIHTRPAGSLARSYKWVLRNKFAACFGLVFLFVLTFSVFGVIRRTTEAARKRQIAINRLHELVSLTDTLAGELYDSVHGLQGAEAAQMALLNSAHQAIDKLAAKEAHDPQLAVELAREYDKLARLELGLTPLTAQTLRQSSDDVTKETQLLRGIPDNIANKDPEIARLLGATEVLRRTQNVASNQLHH